MEPYLQLAVPFLNVVLKQTKAQLSLFPMSVSHVGSYLQVLQLRFRIHFRLSSNYVIP